MKKLKHVKKLDQNGCTFACIAIITGKSYFEIRDAAHKYVPRLYNIWVDHHFLGLYAQEIIDFLKSGFGIQSKLIKFVSLRALKKHCVLFICPLNGDRRYGHGVVFDAKKCCIIDPDEILEDLKDWNVFCCIEIQ